MLRQRRNLARLNVLPNRSLVSDGGEWLTSASPAVQPEVAVGQALIKED